MFLVQLSILTRVAMKLWFQILSTNPPKTSGYICIYMHARSLQSCLTLCDPIDCSLPGSSVYGILQARILEWVDMPSSRGSSWPRDRTHISGLPHWQAGSLPLAPLWRLIYMCVCVYTCTHTHIKFKKKTSSKTKQSASYQATHFPVWLSLLPAS